MKACGSLGVSLMMVLLAGCGLQSTGVAPAVVTGAAGAAIKGNVHGGQQPVVGAHVYLFAAGTSGYGGASTSLITSGSSGSDALGEYVLTDGSGAFSITGDYTCTSGTQVYLLSTQGNPGLPPGQSNANIGLMTALGTCTDGASLAAAYPFVVINEVTTVASVYAVSGFMTDATHVASSGSALAQVGIANAFAAMPNMVNVATGLAVVNTGTPRSTGVAPQSEINTLANILASCVNSVGAASPACTTLFGAALNGMTQPGDTATAALNIAHNPAKNIATLFGLQTATAPFGPVLMAAPNDFTVALSFAGGGLNRPGSVAIDGAGDVWAANQAGSLSELSGVGVPMSPNFTGYAGVAPQPDAIAIDTQGNVWVPNAGSNNSISKVKSNGTAAMGSPFTGGALADPGGVAIDASGNVWITNFNGGNPTEVISEFNGGTGAPIAASGYFGAGDYSVAIDALGFVWTSFATTTEVVKMGSNGVSTGSFPANGGGGPMAIDASGNVWIAGGTGTSKLLNNGTPAGGPFSGGGQCRVCANGIAIDGLGNVWIADGPSFPSMSPIGIAELNNAGGAVSPSTGFQSKLLGYPDQLAIDGSGNVWVADVQNSGLVEFVGAAAPVVTPLTVGVANNMLGTRP